MNSENVLSFFKEITKIPRESGHEEHIIAYLQDFAAKNGLECKTDDAGNVLITKEAAPGYENVPIGIVNNIIQEQQDGEVVWQIETNNYPELYTASVYNNYKDEQSSGESYR